MYVQNVEYRLTDLDENQVILETLNLSLSCITKMSVLIIGFSTPSVGRGGVYSERLGAKPRKIFESL